jgi:TonB family protein
MFGLARGVLLAGALVAGTAGAAPSPAAPPAAEEAGWCNVAVGVVTAPSATKLAFGLTTLARSGRASGTLSIFTGTGRYDVRFTDAVVPHVLGDGNDHTATPIVVQFDRPISVLAAAVTGLATPTSVPCKPLYSPYSRRAAIGWTHVEPIATFEQRAAAAAPLKAPAPVPYAPAVCEQPYTQPTTVNAFEPQIPEIAYVQKWKGDTTVLVTVDVDGRAVDAQVERSSGHAELDDVALYAARRSSFKAGTFDCAPVVGTYLFLVSFGQT